MARLRNAVILKLVHVRENFIARVAKAAEDFSFGDAVVCAQEPANVFGDEPIGLKLFERVDGISVKQAVFAVQTALLADERKIVAWKAERQCVNLFERVEIQIANVATNHAVRRVRADVSPVRRTGRRVAVVRPHGNNFPAGVVGMNGTPSQTAGSGKQFAELEDFHADQIPSSTAEILSNVRCVDGFTFKNPAFTSKKIGSSGKKIEVFFATECRKEQRWRHDGLFGLKKFFV